MAGDQLRHGRQAGGLPLSATAPGDVVTTLRAAGCVFAEDEARLLAIQSPNPAELAAMVARRAAGLPLEQVLGWAELCGVRIALEPGVFIPRPRTELLVREAAALARPGALMVDLCCGSGAIGATVAAAVPGRIDLHAADIDGAAVRCARANLEPIGGQVHAGDLYEPLPVALRGRVDVLVANVPYVPTTEIALMSREARLHEPLAALDGGADGLDVARRVVAAAPQWLAPGGHLLFETSEAQAPVAADACASAGLTARLAHSDELEATVVIGSRR